MDARPSPPHRILIVRLSALGDLVFCTSLLAGLRGAYPDAHIAWLAAPPLGGLLEDDPRLDQIITLPPGALHGLAGLRATRALLQAEPAFDWVIDAQGLFKSRLLARMVTGRWRVGFASKEPGGFTMHALVAKGGEALQIAHEYRHLARELTAGADPGPPRLLPSARARERANAILQEAGLAAGFIALCPFTTRPQKHWREPYWGELAQRLRTLGLGPCVLFGGPDDMDAARRILQAMPAGMVSLVGRTRIADLAAVIERAQLVIGVDTGLTHIGSAVQRPTIGLWGSTRPYTHGTEAALKILYQDLPCAPCKRRPSCGGAYTCMRDLTPERVAAEASRLLDRA